MPVAFVLSSCRFCQDDVLTLISGPQCVISCSKERRSFPDQDYTCCLAMDGVKILASGFEMAEKVHSDFPVLFEWRLSNIYAPRMYNFSVVAYFACGCLAVKFCHSDIANPCSCSCSLSPLNFSDRFFCLSLSRSSLSQ